MRHLLLLLAAATLAAQDSQHLENIRQLTHGGQNAEAYWSPDGSKLVFQSTRDDLQCDQIFVMDADGSNVRQITDNGAANFAPYWHPSGEKILFSSNMGDPTGRNFDIYMINIDGTGLEQITFSEGFDGFPVFSPDGRYLAFGSNRNQAMEGETNVFIAEWKEEG